MSKMAGRQSLRSSYVEAGDFCAIFEQDMNTLYSLALLLTSDHETAEQCFLVAFDDCLHGSELFTGWERSWSRRAIVKQAIRTVRPRLEDSDSALMPHMGTEDVPRRLMQLRPFDRFVFAMSVLERYTVRECAALLNCVPSDVEKARSRVLQSLGSEGVVPAGELLSQSAPNNLSASARFVA